MAASSRRICAGCCGRIATEGSIHERWETLGRSSFRRDARARQSASRRKPLLKDRLHPTDRLGRERVRRSARRRCGGCTRTAAEHRTSRRDRRLRRGCARAANRARMLRCGTTWRKQGCKQGGMSRRVGARDAVASRCVGPALRKQNSMQRPAGPLSSRLPRIRRDLRRQRGGTVRAALRRHVRTPGSSRVHRTYRVYAC